MKKNSLPPKEQKLTHNHSPDEYDDRTDRFCESGVGLEFLKHLKPCAQCSYCSLRGAEDYIKCPHKEPFPRDGFIAPMDLMNWKKRCPDHVTKPGFEKEDEALFKEHFPDEELPPQE